MQENLQKSMHISVHKSVLLQEIIESLNLKEGARVLDGTINGGGHSKAICGLIGETGTLMGIDLDREALTRAEARLKDCPSQKHLVEGNFREMGKISKELGIKSFDAILLDLGFSSDQLESSGRGFSFTADEPLVMTLKSTPGENDLNASEVLNTWEEDNIADVIYGYGEERFARRIAHKIVEARKIKKIEKTKDLVNIIESVVPAWYRRGRLHPATRTFQALRIVVNDEIEALREGIEEGLKLLSEKGRFSIISFHSTEDRIVKHTFAGAARDGKGTVITKKPITPSEEETKENPRSRSAKLRVFESGQTIREEDRN